MSISAIRLFSVLFAFAALVEVAAPATAQSPGEWHASAWQLWRIGVDGTDLRPLDTTPNCRCGSPDWSPDGKSIAYDVLDQSGAGYETVVVNADGTNRRFVTHGSIPNWSPDGKLIACQASGIQIVNADGSGAETLLGGAHSVRWLPSGRGIVSGMGPQFLLFDLASGKQRKQFRAPNAISHGFGISPDGQRYAFGSLINGLFIAELDDQNSLVSIDNPLTSGTVYHVSWAPDGKRVVFAWRPSPEELTQLYTLDVDTSEPPKLLPGIDTKHQNVNPDWSPDGRTIVFSLPAPLSSSP